MKVILFVAQRIANENKGIFYLIDACHKMAAEHPEMVDNTFVAVLGGGRGNIGDVFDFCTGNLGYVNDTRRIIDIYNAADVFVLPSLSENLPNTIMEAMACGVPCVGFNVGGIPEEIDHLKNGYVAEYRNVSDLAKGLYWVLNEADSGTLSREAVRKVTTSYSQHAVAMKYIEVYNRALSLKNNRT